MAGCKDHGREKSQTDEASAEDYQAARTKVNAERAEEAANRAAVEADRAQKEAERAERARRAAQRGGMDAPLPAQPATSEVPRVDEPRAPDPSQPTAHRTARIVLRCSSGATASLRAEATVDSEKLADVPVGSMVELLGESAVDRDFTEQWRWHRVRSGEAEGWLHQNSIEDLHAASPPCNNR
ncbi:MAG: hypothetical protein IT372_35050 [Polyangiaceae bacterium]|nr:hypothetical protein [Polyangiaceae bacterium]